MKPVIYIDYTMDGLAILPFISVIWRSDWYRLCIHIGWLFWFINVEWQ